MDNEMIDKTLKQWHAEYPSFIPIKFTMTNFEAECDPFSKLDLVEIFKTKYIETKFYSEIITSNNVETIG